MIHTLVLSSGGFKGISFIGALNALEEQGMLSTIKTYIGTSMGAVLLALISIGYGSQELKDLLLKLDLTKLRHINENSLLHFLDTYGLDSGQNVTKILEIIIRAKCGKENFTLGELYETRKKRLVIVTVCLTRAKVVYLDHRTHPDLPIVEAIRMSSSIPLYFHPYCYQEELYIDGAVLDGFAIHLVKPDPHVLGISIDARGCHDIDSFENYINSLFRMVSKKLRSLRRMKRYRPFVIEYEVDQRFHLKFDMSYDDKIALLQQGYVAVMKAFLQKPHLTAMIQAKQQAEHTEEESEEIDAPHSASSEALAEYDSLEESGPDSTDENEPEPSHVESIMEELSQLE